jgi:enterochelin esterase-like enzyme
LKFKIIAIIVSTLTAAMVLQACSNGTSSSSTIKPVESSIVQKTIETPKSIETSKPTPIPSPTVENITFHSDSLKKDMPSNIYLPKGYDKQIKYPVLYLISYSGGTENAIIPNLGLQDKADQFITDKKIKPLIIVTINLEFNFKDETYENYIMKDLISYIDSHYSSISSKEGRYIGGFSAGGSVALTLGLGHPDIFSKVGGHSASIDLDESVYTYPTVEFKKTHDPFLLASSGKLSGTSVHLDCGEQDDIYIADETLYKKLQEQHVTVEFHHREGAHDTTYWTSQLEDYLMFYSRITK